MASTLTLTALEGIPSIAAGDDLGALILSSARASALDFRDGDMDGNEATLEVNAIFGGAEIKHVLTITGMRA